MPVRDAEFDARVLRAWNAGTRALEIAIAEGIKVERMYHDLNRILNAAAPDPRQMEMFPCPETT